MNEQRGSDMAWSKEAMIKVCKQCGARNMLYKRLCFKCFWPSFHEPTEKEDD